MALTENQITRYSRHILLQGVGGVGQQTLLNSRVLVVGAGGLGSPVSLYLAASGVGTIGVVDADEVELSNLQRQIAHRTDDIGRAKVASAAAAIAEINPDVTVEQHPYRLNVDNALELVSSYDFVVEGTDNFPTKFLVNDACVFAQKPFSIGGILRFQGSTITHTPGSACYRCVFRNPPPKDAVPTCSQAGVFGAVAGMLGTVQAAETVKYLLGIGELLTDRVLSFDALTMEWRRASVSRDHNCPVCGDSPSITELVEAEQPSCALRPGETAGHEAENNKTATGEPAGRDRP